MQAVQQLGILSEPRSSAHHPTKFLKLYLQGSLMEMRLFTSIDRQPPYKMTENKYLGWETKRTERSQSALTDLKYKFKFTT